MGYAFQYRMQYLALETAAYVKAIIFQIHVTVCNYQNVAHQLIRFIAIFAMISTTQTTESA
jgi:hypothetical protein